MSTLGEAKAVYDAGAFDDHGFGREALVRAAGALLGLEGGCGCEGPCKVEHFLAHAEVVLKVLAELRYSDRTCEALCPCCRRRCSGEHAGQTHGVAPDGHWGGAKS